MADYKKTYPELKAWQVEWCYWYERETGFDVVFDDNQTFCETQVWNTKWFIAWTTETLQRLRAGPPLKARPRKR